MILLFIMNILIHINNSAMLSSVITEINNIINIYTSSTYGKGTKELELRFTLPKWLDTTNLLTLYPYDIETYVEHIYNRNDKNNSRTRVRDYGNRREITTKYMIIKKRNHIHDIDVVLSYEENTLILPPYRPYKIITCTRYIKNIGNVMVDIKVVEDLVRLEIEILRENYIEDLTKVMLTISDTLYNSSTIISPKIFSILLDVYNKYVIKCPLPEHISAKKLGKLIGPWMVTQKIDGERRFLCITTYGIYAINRSARIFIVSDKNISIKYQSIVDCEYYNNIYYIMDCIMVSSIIVADMDYVTRIRKLQSLVDILPKSCMGSKSYYLCNNTIIRTIIEDTLHYKIYDGIILVDANSRYHDTQYKIKKLSTCDMLYNGESLLSSDNISYTPHNSNKLIAGTIYECSHIDRSNTWRTIRPRYDKTRANYSDIIARSLRSITLYELYNERYKIMAGYHNMIKYMILSTHNNNGILLDIGSGRGADISKWSRYKKVYCVEPDTNNLNEMINRSLNIAPITEIVMIPHRLSEYHKISNFIIDKITNITLFFCLMMFQPDDTVSLSNILRDKCNDDCTIDIITTSRELMEPLIGSTCVKKYNNNTVVVTIPGTYIKNNTEYLIDLKLIDDIICTYGFTLWLRTKLGPHYMMLVTDIDISNAYIYLSYNRGTCRNNTIRNSDNIPRYHNVLVNTNGQYTLSHIKCTYNLILKSGTKYYCQDIRSHVLF